MPFLVITKLDLYKNTKTMENNVFEAIIPLKIQDLVSLIIEKKQFDFDASLQYLYNSQLYAALSVEETKLWHLSSEKLLDMLEKEEHTGNLEYPDFF